LHVSIILLALVCLSILGDNLNSTNSEKDGAVGFLSRADEGIDGKQL